ncbi:uncharacterized protein isoform X1 [Takifugu rubripes]|uniref:uncharacterized protein isoform X1 n=2 Tax=Takifugu rubripes TaxID=31033 RepID=UPI00114525E3|nr:uncharacterized protein LOC105418132 isoform X1 [Takifugu rubripes]
MRVTFCSQVTAPVLGCQTPQSVTLLPLVQRNNSHWDKGSHNAALGDLHMCRAIMEESYETFEEELGPQRVDPPPQKPAGQIRRPEMYAKRKLTEEWAPQRPRAEARTLPKEPSFSRTTSLHRTLSIQNLSQMEKPWENVTLNRCLFVAITILVLTSGFQRLHEAVRGQRAMEEEEDAGLRVRRSGALQQRGQDLEPETSLWEVMFWWLPDLDDEDDEEEDDDLQRVKTRTGGTARPLRGLRNKPLTDKKLMKRRGENLKVRRAKKKGQDKLKEKREREEIDDADGAEEENEESGLKDEQLRERKVKKKTPKS